MLVLMSVCLFFSELKTRGGYVSAIIQFFDTNFTKPVVVKSKLVTSSEKKIKVGNLTKTPDDEKKIKVKNLTKKPADEKEIKVVEVEGEILRYVCKVLFHFSEIMLSTKLVDILKMGRLLNIYSKSLTSIFKYDENVFSTILWKGGMTKTKYTYPEGTLPYQQIC